MNYTVISKLPTTFNYVKWQRTNGMFIPEYQILINGGAGVVGGSFPTGLLLTVLFLLPKESPQR